MCFLPQLRCCPWRGLGSSCAWGGGPLGEERGSGATLGRNRTVATVKTGSWPCAWVLSHIPSLLGELKRLPLHVVRLTVQGCPPPLSPVVSLLLVPRFYSVSDCTHQNLELFKNLYICRASNDNLLQPAGGAVAWCPSLLKR